MPHPPSCARLGGPSRAAGPSPPPDEDHTPQQIPLHLEGVEAAHVLGRVDPAENNASRPERVGGLPRIGGAPGDVAAGLEEGKGAPSG